MFTKFIDFLAKVDPDKLLEVSRSLITMCDEIVKGLIPVVGALGAILCVVLCVKYAKAEDPQEHEKAKHGLKNAIIGFGLIFALLIILKLVANVLPVWLASYDQSALF